MKISKNFPLFCLCMFSFVLGCTNSVNPPNNNNNNNNNSGNNGGNGSPQQPTTPTLTSGSWQCFFNNIGYQGKIDTSFAVYQTTGSQDTFVHVTGTSTDKIANIRMIISINRRIRPTGVVTTTSNAVFTFDTSFSSLFHASTYSNSLVTFNIDTFSNGYLSGTFSGDVRLQNTSGGSPSQISNGRFNCNLGIGNNEPKFFSYIGETDPAAGYFQTAKFIGNTLIMQGYNFSWGPNVWFRISVRTGEAIRAGTYHSQNGDVVLEQFVPSIYKPFINDSWGNISVTITTVTSNYIEGTFVGTTITGTPISQGKFRCRLNSYIPNAEAANRWMFGLENTVFDLGYYLFAGNTTIASLNQNLNNNVLTIIGTSDNNLSKMKLVLVSATPISTGIYSAYPFSGTGRFIDSFYYQYGGQTFIPNGLRVSKYENNNQPTYIAIDTLTSAKVVGKIYGKAIISTNGTTRLTDVKLGRFAANF